MGCPRRKAVVRTADINAPAKAAQAIKPLVVPMSDTRAGQGLILLLGITQRSGTNYCHKVLTCHPDCSGTQFELWEDFLIHESHRLLSYVSAASQHWNAKWHAESLLHTSLLEALGAGLTTFLRQGCHSRYLIAKTPSLRGIEHIPLLLPGSRLLIVVRDGRDVVTSGMRSFGWDFQRAVDFWTNGAREIMRFRDNHPGFGFLLVRYEDLVTRLPEVVGQLCHYLDVAPSLFDVEAALRLPVLGSCDDIDANGRVHWRRVERTDDFQPVGRWRSNFTEAEHAEFWDRAHGEMAALGYQRDR